MQNYFDKIPSLQKQVEKNPYDQAAFYSLGVAYLETGQHGNALKCFLTLVRLNPESPQNFCSLGWAYLHMGEFKKALESYIKASHILPNLVIALSGEADAYYRLGDYESAYNCIQRLFYQDRESSDKIQLNSLEPENSVAALRVYSKLCHRYEKCDDCIELLFYALKDGRISKETRISLLYALATLFDKVGNYKTAFKTFRQANKLAALEYSHRTECSKNDTILSSFSSSDMPDPLVRDDTAATRRSIFILGMPRSGTSLVEQILSSHTDIFAAGELITMTEIANVLNSQCDYPHRLEKLTQNVLGQAAMHYLTTINELSGNELVVTDKMPANFIHLGLIALLFPQAKIIHVLRNPLDVCLSIYFQRFPGAHTYSSDLKNIALYYLEYVRIMKHWERVLPITIQNICYEQLVLEQEKTSRLLLKSCGLDWDAQCLNFFNTERVVKTASQDQVKQKMYTSSINRWKKYESYIPLSVKNLLLNEQDIYFQTLKNLMSDDAHEVFIAS